MTEAEFVERVTDIGIWVSIGLLLFLLYLLWDISRYGN